MDTTIADLESGLKEQQNSLTESIRSLEEQLLRNKEGYLKVQGALEILALLKQKQEQASNKEKLIVQGAD